MMGSTVIRLVLLALLIVLLEDVSAPHLHEVAEPGVYNHEHDSRLAAAWNITALSITSLVVVAAVESAPLLGPRSAEIRPVTPGGRTGSRDPPPRKLGSA